MKNKERLQFNVTLNQEEFDTIQILKNNYAINISGCFKLLLKNYRKQLEEYKIKVEQPKQPKQPQ